MAPFTLSGTGLGNVELQNGAPVLLGTPQLMSGTEANATSVTYRYYLQATPSTGMSTTTSTGLFQDGTVTLTFAAGAFSETNGTTDVASNMAGLTQSFTVSASAAGGATTAKTISLGPLSLQGPTISLGNFGFKDGLLDMTITVGANQASLNFGGGSSGQSSSGGTQSSSGISVNLTGIVGTLEVQVDALGLLSGKFRVNVPGNFSFRVASLTVQVPNVVNVSATGIAVTYNPAGPSNQTLVVVDSATISFPELNLTGAILPFNPATGQSVAGNSTAKGLIPGLTVYENGFTLGEAELIYGVGGQTSSLSTTGSSPTISLGGIVTFNDIRIGVQNFSVTFSPTVDLRRIDHHRHGRRHVPAGQAGVGDDQPRAGRAGPERHPPGCDAGDGDLRLGRPGGLVPVLRRQMTVQLELVRDADGDQVQPQHGRGGPTSRSCRSAPSARPCQIGSLSITGTANNFAFLGDGSFETAARLRRGALRRLGDRASASSGRAGCRSRSTRSASSGPTSRPTRPTSC